MHNYVIQTNNSFKIHDPQDESHWAEEGTIKKHSRQAAKRHQVAESDRKDYLRVTSEHNNVKAAIKAMGTPDELHVNEGGIFEEDSNRLCSRFYTLVMYYVKMDSYKYFLYNGTFWQNNGKS